MSDLFTAALGRPRVVNKHRVDCYGHYHANGEQCSEPWRCRAVHEVRLKWTSKIERNLVVGVGLDALINNSFNAAAGAVTWFVGLIGAGAGTVAITSGAAAVTGTGTAFAAALATAPAADIIIVGAGAAGADLVSTVASRTSTTAITTAANAGTTVSAASYATEPVAGDVMSALSFTDTVPYSNASRPAWTKNGASSGGAGAMSNSASKAVFTINATGRIFGLFLTDSSTKSGTSGTLYGGGLFAGGSRAVLSGDTLNAQVDLSVVAS
jgi:hypothetical protein